MKSLERTQVERFLLEDSLTLSEVEQMVKEGTLKEHITEIEAVFEKYRRLILKPEADRFLYNGNSFWASNSRTEDFWQEDEIVRACDSRGVFLGLYRYHAKEKTFRPYKMFL